ncbi:hypothetical protein [Glycomyces sp. NPDC048151]|uniref:hypothetical protein n=1 Tax=Glycomyces sp. NPDC048151 TaxID=3364002 RepID=UPI00371C959F
MTFTFDDAIRAAENDPAVVGLFLIGSHSMEGLATEHSDHDLFVVTRGETELARHHGLRSPALDLNVIAFDELAAIPSYVDYALARSRVLLDRTGGELTAFLEAKGRLDPQTAFDRAAEILDGYANYMFRSVKNQRDGRVLAGRLDAADSIGALLELLFTMDLRPRPYNKALEWELERRPLPGWDTAALLDDIQRIIDTGDTDVQRRLFAEVEAKARNAGHGKVLDEWGDNLAIMRPAGS